MPGIIERWRSLFRPSLVLYNFGPDAPADVLNLTARKLYNTQDNLAAVVNFLANSIAQLPLKVYARDGENERRRDRTSPAALLLWRPNADQTEYEFMRALAIEYFVFGCVYVWILPDADSPSGWQARIIPTEWVSSTAKANNYAPDKITVVSSGGSAVEIPRTEFVRFCTYSPGNPGGYISPISALRQTLEEQIQAGRFRRDLWKSSGRLNAQIVRPKDVQPWTDATKKAWIEAFREAWGAGGTNAGKIPLMEDGMEIKPFSTSFKEQQWAESIKLSREAVAAAYGINPSLVWHSDTQTYASSKDNARALYAECLGPVLQMLQQRLNAFLLPMVGADPSTYVEFDLTEKLKGSFEERAQIMQASVGGPGLTRNEARADVNLPPIEGGDELIVPLNVVTGGQASPQDTHMGQLSGAATRFKNGGRDVKTAPSEDECGEVEKALRKFFKRQASSVLPKLGAKSATWWDAERWDKELAKDLEPILADIAAVHGEEMADALDTEYIREWAANYLKKITMSQAQKINKETLRKLLAAMEAEAEDEVELLKHEMEQREDNESSLLGRMLARTFAGIGTSEASRQAKEQGSRKRVFKEWVTGPNARMSHALMNGERVPIDDAFSNGAYWPGDDTLDAAESCYCNCTTSIIVMEGAST